MSPAASGGWLTVCFSVERLETRHSLSGLTESSWSEFRVPTKNGLIYVPSAALIVGVFDVCEISDCV
jgi:hypothetical protein